MHTIIKPGQVLPDILHHDPSIPEKAWVGTSRTNRVYSKQGPRSWGDSGSFVDPYHLVGTPMYLAGNEEVPITLASPEVFLWRLRDVALAAAERSGVSERTVTEMCSAFGAPEPLLYEGGIVSSHRDMLSLPAGTTLYFGHPSVTTTMSVWEWDGDQLQHLVGRTQHRADGSPLTIHKMPGEHGTPNMEPGDDATISRLALRAWRVGKTYKSRHGWCSVFENCLHMLGIDNESVATAGTTLGPGDEVSGEAAIAALPEGTILYHLFRNTEAVAFFIRDNSARNAAKTRRLWGHNDTGRNSTAIMTIVSTPEEAIVGVPCMGSVLRNAPDGTLYHRTGYNTVYTKGDEMRDRVIDHWGHYTITHIVTEENAA